MRLYRLTALTLLSISLSLTLAKTPTTSSDHGFVVRKTRSHAELASRLDFKAAEDTARDVVGDVIKAVINETVGFVATRLSLKHVPVIDKPKASDKKLIHAFRMTTPNGRTKYRVLPSGGEFRLPITIGGKSYEPLADTGSSDILLDSKAGYIGPPESNTGKRFHAAYGGGADVQGDIYLDNVTALGITIPNLAVGKTTTGSLIAEDLKPPPSGVFGLGYDGSSTFFLNTGDKRLEPFMVRSVRTGLLKQFAIDLSTKGGSIDVNSAVNSAGVGFTNIGEDGYWSLSGTINGQTISGTIDSGTDHILGPKDDVLKLFKAMGLQIIEDDVGNVGAHVGCYKGATLDFVFGSATATVTGPTSTTPREEGGCVLSLFGVDGLTDWIIGQPFFFSTYTVFDPVNKRIGLKSKQPSESVPSTAGTPQNSTDPTNNGTTTDTGPTTNTTVTNPPTDTTNTTNTTNTTGTPTIPIPTVGPPSNSTTTVNPPTIPSPADDPHRVAIPNGPWPIDPCHGGSCKEEQPKKASVLKAPGRCPSKHSRS